MKAIIPVAGIGTRLRPHTHTAPKVLLPVAGKPILSHILDELVELGFDEITFIVGYKGEMITEYVRENYSIKANFVQQNEMLGLGHAISLARPHHDTDEPVLIILGDTIFQCDLKSVFEGGVSAIGVKTVEDARRFGIVELTPAGGIKRLLEKPDVPPTNLAIVGIYYLTNPKLLFDCLDENIRDNKRIKGEFQLTDALQMSLDRGENMRVFMVDGWYDCGKPETMLETNRDLLDRKHSDFSVITNLKEQYPDCVIIPPVAIHPSVTMEQSIVGPYVSISQGASIHSTIISNTIIGQNTDVARITLEGSIISDNAKVRGNRYHLNVGDGSEVLLS
jgi:glucose-1-phosphate thymidylyltransferase